MASGGDGEYTYHPATDNFYPTQGQIWKRLDWRVPTGEWDRNHAKPDLSGIGKQEFFLFHQPYFQSRTWAIKDFKTVIVTRSILACLESRYIKLSHAPYIEKIFLNDSNTFDWDGELKNIISFYNSWGDVMRWHPNIRHFKFEDLKKNTVKNFSDLLNFWGYDISDQYIEEGFRRVTKYEMLARMGTDKTNQRITTLSKNERGIIPADVFRRAIEVLNRDLVYDFGYSYTPDSQYVQDLK